MSGSEYNPDLDLDVEIFLMLTQTRYIFTSFGLISKKNALVKQ
jgi:hypothetical protein